MPDITPAAPAPAPATDPAATPTPAAAAPAPTPAPAPEKKSVLKGAAEAPKDATKEGAKDGAAADPAKAKEGSDEPYVLKLPEGVTVDKAKLEKFTGWAKENKLTPEQASKAVTLYAEQQQAAVTEWAAKGDAWYADLEKDAEFGGQNLKASEVALQKALKRFDPKGDLVKDLEHYGVENLPSLAKFLRRVGLAAAEDKTVVDTAKVADTKVVPTENERLARRYKSLAPSLLGTK